MKQSPHSHRKRMGVPAASRVIDYARHVGFRRTMLRGAYVMVNQVLNFSGFEAMTLVREKINTDLLPRDALECRFLTEGEMLNYATEIDGQGAQMLSHAARYGNLCYAVLDGKSLANFGFFSNRPTPLLGDLEMHFDTDYWYMYGAWTISEYRGQRLHARSVLGGALELLGRGIPALVTVAEMTNYPSIISAVRMGWQFSGKLYCVSVGNRSWYDATAKARAFGMQLKHRSEDGLN